MLTSIVCIGDLHFAPGPRQADRERALDQIISEGLALEQLGAWVMPGDLFDAGAAAKDCNGFDERLQRMASAAPVLLTYGNHDRAGDLDGFARLQAACPIFVVSRPMTVRFALATGQTASIFVLPYPHRAGLVSAGVAKDQVVAIGADLLEPIFMVAAAELQAAHAAGDLTMMIGHVNIAGSIASTGQPQIGHEIELHPRHLDRLGDIPKIFSHIHKPQELHGAHYIGSICRLDYGEIEAKRYLVIDFDDEETHIRSCPIDVAPMFHITGTLDRNGFTLSAESAADAEIWRRYCAVDWTGCDVRVRYSHQASEGEVLYKQILDEAFGSALRLKIESVVISDRELRAPAVAAAKTVPDKLAAMRQVEQLPASVAGKVAALQNCSKDELLTELAAMLRDIEQPQKETVAA
jgi:DNA repair exonuclease SbcCD nuclease subunit